MEIRDPIHGAMVVSAGEIRVADHPFLQRLRNIAQTGFSQLPFPGATHSRYAHSLGVMHLSGKAFDQAYADWHFDQPEARERFRKAVRLAALCHDLGHAPFSHCTEFAMPTLESLGLSWYRTPLDRRATHEDYTIAILEQTSLNGHLEAHTGISAQHVAALISADVRVTDDFFLDGGLDHRRLLSQLISSELDVDRLDYLVRDATYTGARYGFVDVSWLLSALKPWTKDGQVGLALDGAAIYAFEDFLIARHHMFLMVYFHHRSVVYEELLRRFVTTSGWQLPSDLDEYLFVDDVYLHSMLRASDSPWARRIVENRVYKRVLERHGTPKQVDLSREEASLVEAGIDVISAGCTGRLSRYAALGGRRKTSVPIYVLGHPEAGRRGVVPLTEASTVFRRYADARQIARLYVAPEDEDAARKLLDAS